MKILRASLVLAGDVGGTKTRLGLFQASAKGMRLLRARDFPSMAYSGLERVVEGFIAGRERIEAACFGVAGPVVEGTAVATNLPWKVSASSLKRFLSTPAVSVINDLVANAGGIGVLKKSGWLPRQPIVPLHPPGSRQVQNRGRHRARPPGRSRESSEPGRRGAPC